MKQNTEQDMQKNLRIKSFVGVYLYRQQNLNYQHSNITTLCIAQTCLQNLCCLTFKEQYMLVASISSFDIQTYSLWVA